MRFNELLVVILVSLTGLVRGYSLPVVLEGEAIKSYATRLAQCIYQNHPKILNAPSWGLLADGIVQSNYQMIYAAFRTAPIKEISVDMANAFADYCEACGVKIIRTVPGGSTGGYTAAILQYYGSTTPRPANSL